MGQLYQRGRIYWLKYYVNGRPVRESTGCEKEQEARRFLKTREGDAAKGQPILPHADRVRYEAAAADLRQHYEATGARDLAEYDRRVAHLTRFFPGRRIAGIGQVDVDAYVLHRHEQGVVGSTIRRELGTLTKMLRLAYRNGKLLRLPLLDKPKEGAPREGFFERGQYHAVRRRLPEDLQIAVTIAYTFGWRMQSEILALERRQLDLEAGTLRLDPGQTKNDEGRVVYLTPELRALLRAQVTRVEALQRRLGRIVPFLFSRLGQGQRAGQRRGDFWKVLGDGVQGGRGARDASARLPPHGGAQHGEPERTGACRDEGDGAQDARRLAGTIPGTINAGAIKSSVQPVDNSQIGG